MNARSFAWLLGGVGLSVATLAAAWGWIALAGEPFGNWDWRNLAFALLVVELLALGAIAAASGPFEQRFRRWDVPTDPLAIRFQMDLAATELVAPRRVSIDERPLLLGAPVLVVALVLGVTLAARDDAHARLPIEVGEAERIAIEAERARGARVASKPVGTLLMTAGAARERLDGVTLTAASDDDLIYLIYFTPATSNGQPLATTEPGPVVAVDAWSGAIVGRGEGAYTPR